MIRDNIKKSNATDVVSRENSHNCFGSNFISTECNSPSPSFADDPAFSRPRAETPRALVNPGAGRVKGVFPPPVVPEAAASAPQGDKGGKGCGYCRHKVFGRGKIVEQLPPDKCRVNFPGFGLKVILTAFLTLED